MRRKGDRTHREVVLAKRARKRWLDVLRIAVCAVALYFVLQNVTLNDHVLLTNDEPPLIGTVHDDGGPVVIELLDGATRTLARNEIAQDKDGALLIQYGLKTAFRNSHKGLLLLAVLIHLPVGVLQGVRLRWLLSAQGIDVGYWNCVKLSFAGNFLNFAAPLGSTAGDVFKAYFVSLHTDRKTEAVTTIALDRILGLATLLFVVAVITLSSPDASRLAELRVYVLSALGVGMAAGLVYLAPGLRRFLIPHRFLARPPMADQIQRVDKTARVLAMRPKTVGAAVLVTVLLQATALTAYFVVALAVGMNAHAGNLFEYYAYFYTGCVVQSLPGPPQGLGTVELAYRYFFQDYGGPSQIVCMALAARLVVLTCALPGVLVTLTGSYKPLDATLLRNDAASEDEPDAARLETR